MTGISPNTNDCGAITIDCASFQQWDNTCSFAPVLPAFARLSNNNIVPMPVENRPLKIIDPEVIALKPDHLEIKTSPIHGRGVFTSIPIRKGQLIELAPILLLNEAESSSIKQSSLYPYYFLHGKKGECCLIGLGYGSLYNHACPANARYKIRLKMKVMEFIAFRDIGAEEEITINYNGDPLDASLVEFDPINEEPENDML
ncbi:SET domain-containing protein-lysine N-methyltransferase [Flavitalea flava]